MNTKIDKCDICQGPANVDNDHIIDGLLICPKCWPKYAEDNNLCPNCGSMLRPIYENNGFQEPEGPSHFEVTGFEPCEVCSNGDDGGDR